MRSTFLLFFCLALISVYSVADEETINTLSELKKSQVILKDEIKTKTLVKKKSVDNEEKEQLDLEIKVLQTKANDFQMKFEKIATGIDVTLVREKEDQPSSTLGEDFQLLIRPLLHAAKQSTEEMRNKAKLQDELEHYKNILFYASKAYQNINRLMIDQNSTAIEKELMALGKHWEQRVMMISSNLKATEQHLHMIEKENVSLTQSFRNSFKNFFQTQGLVLLKALGAFLLVIIMVQTLHMVFVKVFPILIKSNRPFSIRLLDLAYWIIAVLLAIFTPMAIFYYEENWVLSSIGILILFGIMWTFKNLIPKLWKQARLFLNVGSVRQEERIYYQNLPWRVRNINIFTILENPDSGVKLRLPIEELVGLTSRPTLPNEPWFPCKLDDWVLLSDKYYGKVVGISLEFIELVDYAGGRKTYIVSDFLSLSPLNLSTGFLILDTIGISYRHQRESTHEVTVLLEEYIGKQIEVEGYQNGLKDLFVQFSHAGNSSLDIRVVASFTGDMASIYFLLQRAIGRWCVDACTEYGWEIPFPQLTVSRPKN